MKAVFFLQRVKEFIKNKIPCRRGQCRYHGQRARLEYRNVHQPGKRQRDDNVSYDFKNDSMEDSFFNAFI
ncbi:hypothetical protein OUHCRE12_06860 [Enterobacter kobei]